MSAPVALRPIPRRRGAVVPLAAVLMVFMLGMVAFSVDVGYISLTRSQMQNAADSAVLAAAAHIPSSTSDAVDDARRYAGFQTIGTSSLGAVSVDVGFGTWDAGAHKFTESTSPGNAVKVTVQRDAEHGGGVSLFFAPVFGKRSFDCKASAVAMVNPRDIAFVVDLSGSMNNDTEPAWATYEIDHHFAPYGYPTVADSLMRDLYSDLNYGTFPGTLQYVGQTLGVAQDQYAYAEMTKNSGPLTSSSISSTYRISNTDSEATRKTKAYKYIMDKQIKVIMPNATPAPNISDSASVSYWTAYLDYLMKPQQITSSSAKGKPRPSYPVTLPPSQSSNQITGMGNPYTDSYPDASSSVVQGYQNYVGYRTYVNFMMDFGRNAQPASGQYVPLSRSSSLCRYHTEVTDGGTFSFPPREQPTHAAHRALIAALQVIKERNQDVSDSNERDWVSIITFDKAAGVQIAQSLTSNYDDAMLACTRFQAVGDLDSSTATENGLIKAKNHIASPDSGGQGRRYTNKVVVFLTDGIPNLYQSSTSTINNYIGAHPNSDYYSSSKYSYNAALMQCMAMQLQKWQVFPVGLGLGTDYDFMDRCARMGGTANPDGESARGSGNPAEYEERLKEIFENIISNPKARLVQQAVRSPW